MNPIIKATKLANKLHKGQTRKDHITPFITHPMWIAYRTSLVTNSSEEMVAAAWAHDVLEESNISLDGLTQIVGVEIADLVDELTNRYEDTKYGNRKERKALELERLKSISRPAQTIKLIDRIHNLMTRNIKEDYAHLIKNYLPESQDLVNHLCLADPDIRMELQTLINSVKEEAHAYSRTK